MITFQTLDNLIVQSIGQLGLEKTTVLLQDLLEADRLLPSMPLLGKEAEMTGLAWYLRGICGELLGINPDKLYESRQRSYVAIKKLCFVLLYVYTEASYTDIGKHLNHSPRHVRKIVCDCKVELGKPALNPLLIEQFQLLKRHAVAYITGLKTESLPTLQP